MLFTVVVVINNLIVGTTGSYNITIDAHIVDSCRVSLLYLFRIINNVVIFCGTNSAPLRG